MTFWQYLYFLPTLHPRVSCVYVANDSRTKMLRKIYTTKISLKIP